MNRWDERPSEEQRLLNPSFCSMLIWYSARAHGDRNYGGMEFEKCFLVLPIVLHRDTRESLPTKVTTSLPVWLVRNPLAPSTIANRARSLVPFTKEALKFGGAYGTLRFNDAIVYANTDWGNRMARSLEETSDEVRECVHRAEFLGRWFARTGDAETVLSFLGVQP